MVPEGLKWKIINYGPLVIQAWQVWSLWINFEKMPQLTPKLSANYTFSPCGVLFINQTDPYFIYYPNTNPF